MRFLLVGAAILASLAPFLNGRVGASPLPYQEGAERTSTRSQEIIKRGATYDSSMAPTHTNHLEKRSSSTTTTAHSDLQQQQLNRYLNSVAEHRLKQIEHEDKEDEHLKAEAAARKAGDTETADDHKNHAQFHQYKAKFHKTKSLLHLNYANSVLNPQGDQGNSPRVQEMRDRATEYDSEAAGFAALIQEKKNHTGAAR